MMGKISLTSVINWIRIKTQVGTPATPAAGYSIIYEEGGALKLKDDAGTITAFGASTVDDTAYDATSWDNVTTIAPSKNAVRDKFESLSTGGAVVQVVHTQTGAVATGTTVIPIDDTIPQNTEGDEQMSLAITPTNASNILYIDVTVMASSGIAAITRVIAALFQDSTADALAAAFSMDSNQYGGQMVNFRHKMTAGTTSATTFKVRVGLPAAGTHTFNGLAGGRYLGGVLASSITITEVTP
jgi:hypothetical protein